MKKHTKKRRQMPKSNTTPIRVKIHLPAEKEMVKIPIDEYAALITVSTILDTIVKWCKGRKYTDYIQFDELRQLLGVPKDKEDDAE